MILWHEVRRECSRRRTWRGRGLPWGEGLSWNGKGTGIRDKESGGLVQQCRAVEAVAKRLISLSKQVETGEERCLCHKGASGRCRTGGRAGGGRGERVEVLLTWHEAARGREGLWLAVAPPQKMKEENRQQPSFDPGPLFINPSVVERWIL